MLRPSRKLDREGGVLFIKGGTDFIGPELGRSGRRFEDTEAVTQHHRFMRRGTPAGELR